MAAGRVLYRKYRPTKLSDVVGQEQITTALEHTLKQGKIGHAYLFIGPRGTGKTSVARILAHAVNDFPYELEDSYLDIVEIDAASNTGVDNIRELREKAIIAPTTGKYKVYIIDEIHMLSKSAANALLKTLEEPPEHVIFIMATTEANKIPITISSRAQILNFQLADPETMFQHLRKISDTEKISITDGALHIVVRRGGGSFRDSLSLLDQAATLTDQEITETVINRAFGLPAEESIQELLSGYAKNNTEQIRTTLSDLINAGLRPENISAELIGAIINHPTPDTIQLLEKLPQVQPPFPEAKLLLALLGHLSETATPNTSQAFAAPAQTPQPTTSPNDSVEQPAIAREAKKGTETAPPPQKVTDSSETAENKTSQAESTKQVAQTPAPDLPPTPPEPPKAPQPKTANDGPFDWHNFLELVHSENQALYLQLQKAEHELTGDTLHLYPTQKFTAKILKKAENSQYIVSRLNGLGLVVHDFEDRHAAEDPSLSQISAIMGDVREVNGEMPF